MKVSLICALTCWQLVMFAASAPINFNDVQFSPRLLLSRSDGNSFPNLIAVDYAREVLNVLELYHLGPNLVQAKITPSGLLFEMQTDVQAKEVAKTWMQKNGIAKNFDLRQTNQDFYDD
ncbi:uncharacterized protein LOC115620378 [Scaptodrosophila lebanonensis]|uniref:Uncharacterized protein LOC115620378 n=1 Tax=Drosophila lebanonensis TaxID=7225 RepID=A0A6J2T2I4_DROLE|nr:uncharacterized protein LOC115620378 [Scaptodrosophila lebanonensis]